MLSMLGRYGVAPLLYGRTASAVFGKFKLVYWLQHEGKAFKTPEELLTNMGIYKYTQTSASEVLQVCPPNTSCCLHCTCWP